MADDEFDGDEWVLIRLTSNIWKIRVKTCKVNDKTCKYRVGDDFEDADEDDNIEMNTHEDDVENIELLAPGVISGGVQKEKRITTKYMTKYDDLI